jgi:hypothetical protein
LREVRLPLKSLPRPFFAFRDSKCNAAERKLSEHKPYENEVEKKQEKVTAAMEGKKKRQKTKNETQQKTVDKKSHFRSLGFFALTLVVFFASQSTVAMDNVEGH